jgi:hypothetical protein
MLQGSQEWLDLRKQCAVTWSQAANALGIGYDSKQKYMRRQLGLEPPFEGNWLTSEGTRREPWVAELYFRIMGAFGEPVTLWTDAFSFLQQDRRMGGSVDRIVTSNKSGETWVLEIKTCPNGSMRTYIPISHIVQMLGQCQTMKLPKAHYIAHSQGQGLYLAELTWSETLWDEVVYPKLKDFADIWTVRGMPGRTSKSEKEELEKVIRENTFITEIPIVSSIRQLREQQQTIPNKDN